MNWKGYTMNVWIEKPGFEIFRNSLFSKSLWINNPIGKDFHSTLTLIFWGYNQLI